MAAAADEGATPRELLFEACRRNNQTLLREVLDTARTPDKIAELLNTSRDGVGNFCLHAAALYGSYEVLDTLLDQHNLEVDPQDRMEGDTPLHKAVRYTNSLSSEEWEEGMAVVELLIDAGADPRMRNKGKLKAVELVDPRNTALRTVLQKAEYAVMLGDEAGDGVVDEEGVGSGSESD